MCDEDDEVVLSTSKGTIIRQKVKDITIQSRAATGVLIQSIQKDDSIIMVGEWRSSLKEFLIE